MTQSMGEMLQMQSKIVPLYFFARHCFAQDYTALNSPAHQYIGLLWITHWIAGRLSISCWRSLRLRRSLCVPCQSHICLAWANLKKERIPLQIPNQNLKQAIGVWAVELRSWRCSSIAQSMIVKWDVILHKSCTYIYNRHHYINMLTLHHLSLNFPSILNIPKDTYFPEIFSFWHQERAKHIFWDTSSASRLGPSKSTHYFYKKKCQIVPGLVNVFLDLL